LLDPLLAGKFVIWAAAGVASSADTNAITRPDRIMCIERTPSVATPGALEGFLV
jgi:hypothetical protein